MTTINNQPQHLLARYADRTGCDKKIQLSEEFWSDYTGPMSMQEYTSRGGKIRIVLSEYGLPSHLKPYKDNPRLPGDGYRVPTGEDSCNQPHDMWVEAIGDWMNGENEICRFSNLPYNYRLPASVPFPDWEEMTRETAAGETVENQHPAATEAPKNAEFLQHPEIFEAHGLEWYRHDGSVRCPCDPNIKVEWLSESELKSGVEYSALVVVMRASEMSWSGVHVWRPADAPAKLPRPGHTYDSVHAMMVGEGVSQTVQDMVKGLETQDDVQALKARVLKLEGALEHETKLRETYEQACAIWEKNASTPTLRPLAEMPDAVPEGCVRYFFALHGDGKHCYAGPAQSNITDLFLDIRLPAPPDPDEELRREWEKLFSHSDALKQIRESLTEEQVSISFTAFKSKQAKEGAR